VQHDKRILACRENRAVYNRPLFQGVPNPTWMIDIQRPDTMSLQCTRCYVSVTSTRGDYYFRHCPSACPFVCHSHDFTRVNANPNRSSSNFVDYFYVKKPLNFGVDPTVVTASRPLKEFFSIWFGESVANKTRFVGSKYHKLPVQLMGISRGRPLVYQVTDKERQKSYGG